MKFKDTFMLTESINSEFTHFVHLEPGKKRPDMDGTPWGIGKTKEEADADKKKTANYEGLKRGPKTHLYKVHKDAVGPEGGPMVKFGKLHVDHDKREITLKK